MCRTLWYVGVKDVTVMQCDGYVGMPLKYVLACLARECDDVKHVKGVCVNACEKYGGGTCK